VPKVAKGRGRDAEYIDSIGQGRVWSGAQGKANGLVDEFGGLDRAIEIAKGLAKFPLIKAYTASYCPSRATFSTNIFRRR
jgi:protease-4